ncbi:hypothetical protein D3C73_409690 [compost metagenome]
MKDDFITAAELNGLLGTAYNENTDSNNLIEDKELTNREGVTVIDSSKNQQEFVTDRELLSELQQHIYTLTQRVVQLEQALEHEITERLKLTTELETASNKEQMDQEQRSERVKDVELVPVPEPDFDSSSFSRTRTHSVQKKKKKSFFQRFFG